jgi:hypothetical protein
MSIPGVEELIRLGNPTSEEAEKVFLRIFGGTLLMLERALLEEAVLGKRKLVILLPDLAFPGDFLESEILRSYLNGLGYTVEQTESKFVLSW